MTDKSLATLVERIADQTEEGRIKWKPHPIMHDAYVCKLSNYVISISKLENYDSDFGTQEFDYKITISTMEDVVVDEFLDGDISRFQGEDEIGKYYILMKDTYNKARRIATGAHEAVSRILQELDDDAE